MGSGTVPSQSADDCGGHGERISPVVIYSSASLSPRLFFFTFSASLLPAKSEKQPQSDTVPGIVSLHPGAIGAQGGIDTGNTSRGRRVFPNNNNVLSTILKRPGEFYSKKRGKGIWGAAVSTYEDLPLARVGFEPGLPKIV
jgi:hypothetical protein